MMSLRFFRVSVVRIEMIKNIKHLLKMNRLNHIVILSNKNVPRISFQSSKLIKTLIENACHKYLAQSYFDTT